MSSSEPILIIDDDQGVLESFDAMLGDDYPLMLVNNGSDAIEILGTETPKLLFLDIKMPGANGLEVLRRIREKNIKVEVVVITALPQENYQTMAHHYGVYKYLKKPFDVDEVEEITAEVCH